MKANTEGNLLVAAIVVMLLILVVGVDMGINHLAYGDATCAFMKCVRVLP